MKKLKRTAFFNAQLSQQRNRSLLLLFNLFLLSINQRDQSQEDSLSSNKLKKLRLEELMNIEVTSVSKRPEKLTEAASAIQVITSDDIRRSGVTKHGEKVWAEGVLEEGSTFYFTLPATIV